MSIKMMGKAIVLLLLICASFAFGLIGEPIQPEFQSFEPVDATDMVNVATGDFTYTLPLGEVKGPSGTGYPIVLSYHAGIENDQEASWVGLGWDLNVGSINRMVRGFPDDYNDDFVMQYAHNNGETTSGWSWKAGVGIGYPGYNVGLYGGCSYNSKTGHEPIMGIKVCMEVGEGIRVSLSMGNDGSSVGIGVGNEFAIASVGVGFDGQGGAMLGASLDQSLGQLSLANISISTNSGVGMSMGGVSAAVQSVTMSEGGITEAMASSGFGISIPLYYVTVSFDYSEWEHTWQYSQIDAGLGNGYLYQNIDSTFMIIETDNVLLKNLIGESEMWSYLPNGELIRRIPKDGTGQFSLAKKRKSKLQPPMVANTNFLHDKFEYVDGGEFAFGSQDAFTVSGQGMGGGFRAYSNRPSIIKRDHDGLQDGMIGEVANGKGTYLDPYGYKAFNDNKTIISQMFNADGEGSDAIANLTFKMVTENCGNLLDRMEGIDRYVDYIDNQYSPISQRNMGTRITPLIGLDTRYPTKLQGFAITDQRGNSYYYMVPLYSYETTSYVSSAKEPPEQMYKSTHSYKANLSPHATSWLLSAICGPDYIKVVDVKALSEKWDETSPDSIIERLLPHDGDLGYWVRFHYSYGQRVKRVGDELVEVVADDPATQDVDERHPLPKGIHLWRYPYYDENSTDKAHAELPCGGENGNKYVSSFGAKDITYLSSIETSSEIAYFRTSPRKDGYGILPLQRGGTNMNGYPAISEHLLTDDMTTIDDSIGYREVLDNDGHVIDTITGVVEDIPKFKLGDFWDYHLTVPFKSFSPSTYIRPEQCMKIMVPSDKLDSTTWAMLDEGTKLVGLRFSAKMHFLPKNCKSPDIRDSVSDVNSYEFWVEKYTTGCHYPSTLGVPLLSNKMPATLKKNTEPNHQYYTFLGADNKCDLRVVGKVYYQSKTVPIPPQSLKCVWATDDPKTNTTTLYVVAWSKDEGGSMVSFPKGETSGEFQFADYQKITLANVFLAPSFNYGANTRKSARYVKKLDVIAWYSKSSYPFLNPKNDPGISTCEGYYRDNFVGPNKNFESNGYPEVYKKVTLQYDYSLGKNTPNSFAPQKARLTLKSLQHGAGGGAMPPYLFAYQNEDVAYVAHDYSDAWGYRKDNNFTNRQSGVNWNLSKISLPSGGELAMEFERDSIYSPVATIMKLRERESQCNPFDFIYPEDNELFTTLQVESGAGSVLQIKSQDRPKLRNIVPGDLVSAFYAGYDDWQDGECQQRYTTRWTGYSIAAVDQSKGRITIGDGFGSEDKMVTETWIVKVLKSKTAYVDGLRIKTLSTRGHLGNNVRKYTYDGAGVAEVYPQEALDKWFVLDYNYKYFMSGSCFDEYRLSVNYAWDRFTNSIQDRYNSGNSAVLYPKVSVVDGYLDKNGGFVSSNGKTVFEFYTAGSTIETYTHEQKQLVEDKIEPLKLVTPRSSSKIRTVIDRTGIIGMAKSISHFNNSGKLVSAIENHYVFSEQLAPAAGVVTGSDANGMLVVEKSKKIPLGMIHERQMTQWGDKKGDVQNITDVTVSKPFLVAVTQTSNGVSNTVQYGWFDQMTGKSLAELKTNANQPTKLKVSIPAHHIEKTSVFEDKNIYNLEKATIEALVEAPTASIAELKMQDFSGKGNLNIMAATEAMFKIFPMNQGPFGFEQSRYLPFESYSWKGPVFKASGNIGNDKNWTRQSLVKTIDQHARVASEQDAAELTTCVFYHPRINAIVGFVKNAKFGECGLLTGNYNGNEMFSYDKNYDGSNGTAKTFQSFDAQQAWETNGAKLVSDNSLFGSSVIKLENRNQSYLEIARNFKVNPETDYIFSAWVKMGNGTGKFEMHGDYRRLANGADNEMPYSVGYAVSEVKFGCKMITENSTNGKWVYKELKIPASTDVKGDGWYTRVHIGCTLGATAYLQDIRFYPAKSLASTYYYNQNFGVLEAVVNPNNKCKKYEYDKFGRLSKVLNNTGAVLKNSEYFLNIGALDDDEFLRITSTLKDSYRVGEKLNIQWLAHNDVQSVAVYITADRGFIVQEALGRFISRGDPDWANVDWTVALPKGVASGSECRLVLRVYSGKYNNYPAKSNKSFIIR